jgi:probable rRNA maturation factor
VNRTRLRKVATRSLQVEGFDRPAEVSIVLTSDKRIRELNRDYRGVDRPTDVLAFSQLEGEETPGGAEGALGDVIISVETAQRQAAEQGHSLEKELDLLVAHGMLHLLGYDDQTKTEAAKMREQETKILEHVK